jgi:UTP:GlnB (protein PII) uridylyltransferase
MAYMSNPNASQKSPIEELAERLGVTWPNILDARARSAAKRSLLQQKLAATENDDISVVVFGSLARGEFTAKSDVDWASSSFFSTTNLGLAS